MSETNSTSKANKMWGGHFSTAPDRLMQKINNSIDFDFRLYRQDIRGSKAHAQMLTNQGIIDKQEGRAIIEGLTQIEKEIKEGKFEFKQEYEDIHLNIEARLTEIIGAVAGKLHTARSRNDQVAVDFKMYVRDEALKVQHFLRVLLTSLLDKAESHAGDLMPGFTHLQNAQPITIGHYLMAYFQMFSRDLKRFNFLFESISEESPLGSCALAGTSFPTDRNFTSKELGFRKPCENSIDGVSDRDFLLEFLSYASICVCHISRFAEEMVIFSSRQFQMIKFSEKFTSGSSIMPQKRNPDAAELVRAKPGRIYGGLMQMLTVMKGLPLSYSKDMQEDKENSFQVMDEFLLSLEVAGCLVEDLSFNKEQCLYQARLGFTNATEIADHLAKKGVPFREAHHITGKLVKLAEEQGKFLEDLDLKEMQKIEPQIGKDIFEVLKLENIVKSKNSFGGTSPESVKRQIKNGRALLK